MSSFDVSRRTFVIGAATAAAATPAVAAAAGSPAGAAPAANVGDTVPYAFDRAAFTAVLERPFPHRQVLAARSFAEARDGLNLLRNSIEAYINPMYFAAGPNGLHAAAVFYHGNSPLLALDDTMFVKYPLAAAIVKFAGTDKPGIEQGAQANPAGAFYRELVAEHGVSFFVCNNALSGLAAYIAGVVAPAGTPVTRAGVVAIHDDMAAHFLPGTWLVPAGVAALNAAQESRFTLLPS
jgi:intracellular sulfur oxidation DsrE/DsrF family protein